MKWFFYTLFHDLGTFLFKCLLPSCLIGLTVAAVYCFVINKRKKTVNRKVLFKALSLFLIVTVVTLILWLTIGLRFGESYDSLSNIWGNWLIKKMEYSFDFSAVENIIMFLPLPFAVNIFTRLFINKSISKKQSVLRNTIYALCLSAFIECTQIVFSLGLFQVSDLVYNTLGGFLGSILYITVENYINKKTHRQ